LETGPGSRNSGKEALDCRRSNPKQVFRAGGGWPSPGYGLNYLNPERRSRLALAWIRQGDTSRNNMIRQNNKLVRHWRAGLHGFLRHSSGFESIFFVTYFKNFNTILYLIDFTIKIKLSSTMFNNVNAVSVFLTKLQNLKLDPYPSGEQ
jgi:hypothetical protein